MTPVAGAEPWGSDQLMGLIVFAFVAAVLFPPTRRLAVLVGAVVFVAAIVVNVALPGTIEAHR